MKHVVLLPLVYALSLGQSATAETPENPAPEVEEIVVIGQRTMSSLRMQIADSELRVYDVFNALNDDNHYDIHCQDVAPLGTRIKQRRCAPRFLDDAQQQEASAFLMGQPLPPMAAIISYGNQELRKRMEKIARENPDFFAAIKEYSLLKQELVETRKAYFGSTP